ncbi:MAG TPA: type I secretion system permease/ATPase [Ferrovibrio sp.]|uniref:type I secretion system permease/ATPase n=1 Tax=Ferrovibrio sp. TaxID=1917215 RepID=UPI002B4B927A|nr:type I secretion system permease/ATPase [Ferrovibrio sp.]HLT77764.1 type I secretion system permease/ATPase [Ferrovibrio sp.]
MARPFGLGSGPRPELADVLARCRPALAFAALFSFFANLLVLTVPLYMLQVFDRVLSSRSEDTLIMLSILAAGALLVLAILEALRARIQLRIGLWLSRLLGPLLLVQAVERAAAAGDQTSADGLRQLATLRNLLGGPALFHLLDAPWMPVYVGIVALMHPWLGAIAAAGALLLLLLALLAEYATRRPLRQASLLSLQLFGQAEAHLRNAQVIEAMGMLPALAKDWQRDSDAVQALHLRAGDRAGLLASCSKFIRPVVQIAVTAAGVVLVIRGEITAGAMIAAAIIMARALAPVEQMIGSWRSVVEMREAWKRLEKLLSLRPVRRDGLRLPPPQGRLEVDNVTLVPPGGRKPVLHNIRFSLEPGECLGVIGPTAAGKSSLARLLVGIWPPQAGAVRLDGADIFSWNRAELGPHIGYLPQEVALLEGSVGRNIARMGEVDDDAVVTAARLAGVHDMILRLPQGYDTEIGAAGFRLSGGQAQRIALARAFYGTPGLLVLDEPSANLDAEGEAALVAALGHARDLGITCVVIAHRIGTLSGVDKLLLLREGRMAAFGARDEVLAQLQPPKAARQIARRRRPEVSERA